VKRIVVIGASGATGRLLVDGALARGHDVHAVVRNPGSYSHGPHAQLTVHRGDVLDPASIAAVITPQSVVVSGLGARSKSDAGVLTSGARAVLAAHPSAVVWLGAIGTGRSATAVSRLTHSLLKAGFGAEYGDKTAADSLIQDAGHTVVHAGPLNDKAERRLSAVPLASVTHQFFPAFVSRADVARIMLDEAENPTYRGQILIPQRNSRP